MREVLQSPTKLQTPNGNGKFKFPPKTQYQKKASPVDQNKNTHQKLSNDTTTGLLTKTADPEKQATELNPTASQSQLQPIKAKNLSKKSHSIANPQKPNKPLTNSELENIYNPLN